MCHRLAAANEVCFAEGTVPRSLRARGYRPDVPSSISRAAATSPAHQKNRPCGPTSYLLTNIRRSRRRDRGERQDRQREALPRRGRSCHRPSVEFFWQWFQTSKSCERSVALRYTSERHLLPSSSAASAHSRSLAGNERKCRSDGGSHRKQASFCIRAITRLKGESRAPNLSHNDQLGDTSTENGREEGEWGS